MIICIAGKNDISINGIKLILSLGVKHEDIVCVCNKNDEGVNGWQPSYKAFCKSNKLRIVSLEDLYAIENLVFISLEFDQIIKPSLFISEKLYNIHFSYLPEYKGMFTSVFPLMHGKEYSGVTLHKIDRGIDTGDIIDQIKFSISLHETSKELYQLYLNNAKTLLEKNIDALFFDKTVSTPQAALNGSYFGINSIDFSNIKIDLKKTAFEIHNFIRAFCFREYQLPVFFKQKIYRSKITSTKSVGKAGKVVYQDFFCCIVHSIDYDLEIYFEKLDDLFEACKTGDLKTIMLIQASSYDIFTKNSVGWNSLLVACFFSKIEIVQYLLEVGFDPNSRSYKGTTAIMYAKSGTKNSIRFDIIDLLIKAGGDLSLSDDESLTALDYAVAENDVDAIKYFKNKGK